MGDKTAALDAPGAPPPEAERTYKVVCISMYNADVSRLEAMVRELKRRGIVRATKSWLVRLALSRLDIDSITREDRP